MANRRQPASLAKCALAACGLIVLLFADVLFQGASLAPLDYSPTLWPDQNPAAPRSLYPESAGRTIGDSWGDLGSAAWQMQPAIRFMAYCMRTGESPWWDPYSSSGRMGPEGLYGVPFSPVVLASAVFGGSSSAISFVLVAACFLCALSLIRSVNCYLDIGFLGACAAAASYLLNGFALANLNSAIGQPYLLAPLLLLALLRIAERPTFARIAQAGIVQAGMLAITIFPPMALATLACYAIALTATFARSGSLRQGLRGVAPQLAVLPIGLGLIAFLYLPIFEAQLRYAPIGVFYSSRAEYHYAIRSVLSFFTPKNLPPLAGDPGLNHIGVVAFLVAGCGIGKQRERSLTAIVVVAAVLVIVTVGQMFAIPPFSYIGRLPLFNITRPEYWPALAGLPLSILVAFGIENRGRGREIGFGAAASLVIASFVWLDLNRQTAAPVPPAIWVFLATFLFGCLASIHLLLSAKHSRFVAVALAAGIAAEGAYYMNTLRPRRSTRGSDLPLSIQAVKDRLTTPDKGRALNIGRSGLLPDWGSATQIPQLGAMGLVIVPPYLMFFDRYIGRGLFETLDDDSALRFTSASLAAANVRFVIVDKQVTRAIEKLEGLHLKRFSEDPVRVVFESENTLPRAYLVPGVAESDRLPADPELGCCPKSS